MVQLTALADNSLAYFCYFDGWVPRFLIKGFGIVIINFVTQWLNAQHNNLDLDKLIFESFDQ